MAKFNWFAFRQDLSVITGRAFNSITLDNARAVRRRIARHNRLQERRCNRELTEREQAEEIGVETRLKEWFGDALAEFSGDPRGQTVKLREFRDGNPRFEAYRAQWGESPRLTYFSHDWGGFLVFSGGR